MRRLVLVDGVFAPKLSETANLEKGLRIRTLREVLETGDAALHAQLFAPDNSDSMVALNSAMMTDGLVIEVADGAVITLPLHIVHIASGAAPAAMFTRSLIRIGKHAAATLVESYIGAEGANAYQVHDFLIVAIGDGARLDHVRLIEDSREAFNISSAVVTLGANAHFNTFGMTSGSLVSRYQAAHRLCRRGLPGRDQRRQSAQWPPACRHHAVPRSCGAELLEPRDVPRRASTTAAIRCFKAASSCARRRRRPTPR